MPLYTTYLAFLKNANYNPVNIFPNELKETLIYYVRSNRGNDEVAPSKALLEWLARIKSEFGKEWKKVFAAEYWRHYKRKYLRQLRTSPEADRWMKKIAEESKRTNVVLVCLEKDHMHCHRRLLAEGMSQKFGAQYKGELNQSHIG